MVKKMKDTLRTKRAMKATDLDLLHAVNLGLHSFGIYLICEHGQSEGTTDTNRIGSKNRQNISEEFLKAGEKGTECKFKLLG